MVRTTFSDQASPHLDCKCHSVSNMLESEACSFGCATGTCHQPMCLHSRSPHPVSQSFSAPASCMHGLHTCPHRIHIRNGLEGGKHVSTFLAHRICYARATAAQQLHAEPLFILGHPRTGTTHLHNLLSLDPAFAHATTFGAGVLACGPSHATASGECSSNVVCAFDVVSIVPTSACMHAHTQCMAAPA